MPSHASLPNGLALDLAGECLRAGDGTTVVLRPQAFATLRYLIVHANRVVTKEELVSAVWGGAAVTDDSLVQCVHEIRRALGDADRAVVQTVARRGYRLMLPGPVGATPPPGASLAVVVFDCAGEEGLRPRADDLADDLIASLARFPDLLLSASRRPVADLGREGDPRAAAPLASVDYVLCGGLRRSGDRLRVAARLVDGASGLLIWGARFEGGSEEDAVASSEVARRIAGAVEAAVRRAEIARARRKAAAALDAYDLYLRALPHALANTAEDCETALRLLGEALARDPHHLAAHGFAAWCREQRFLRRGFDRDDRDAALAHAARVTGANADDARAMSMGAFVQANLTRDNERGIALLDRALELNPGSPFAYGFSALIAAHDARTDRARDHALRALELSPPDDPLIYHPHCALTVSSLFAGDEAAAVEHAGRTIRANPGFSVPYAYLAAAKARLGDVEGARRAAARLVEAEPGFTVRAFVRGIFRPEIAETLAEALRTACLPEGDGPRF